MITAIEGGACVVERFASLGLVPGTRFKVMRGGSPMAVAVGETRLAFGPDWAEALVVVSQ
jgi:Fe2+ transport system protein FeoA